MPTNSLLQSTFLPLSEWSLLLTGIAYGSFWQGRYTKKELALKDIKAKEKATRDAQLAAEKNMRLAVEMAELEKMAKGSK